MEDERNVKLYSFHIPGYVPGIPREFPGGYQAYVDEDTLEVLAEGPLGQPLQFPLPEASGSPESAEEVPPAPGGVVAQPERVVDASTGFNFVLNEAGTGVSVEG